MPAKEAKATSKPAAPKKAVAKKPAASSANAANKPAAPSKKSAAKPAPKATSKKGAAKVQKTSVNSTPGAAKGKKAPAKPAAKGGKKAPAKPAAKGAAKKAAAKPAAKVAAKKAGEKTAKLTQTKLTAAQKKKTTITTKTGKKIGTYRRSGRDVRRVLKRVTSVPVVHKKKLPTLGRNIVIPDSKRPLKLIVDLSNPVQHGIIDIASFEKFLHDRLKLVKRGKPGMLGDQATISRDKNHVTIASKKPFKKSYIKILTKKFLKKQQLRDWLRVVTKNKDTFELRYYNIQEEGEESESEDED